jgi:hypothetical protein
MGDIMRKKSHLSLAGYLLRSMNIEDLSSHKKAFYIGSILPDCTPSFLSRRHTIDKTFGILKDEIIKITDDYDMDRGITGYYTRHLGVITHYVADYFTYPHNSVFTGTLGEHCVYENDLKHELRAYVKSEEAIRCRDDKRRFRTVDEILNFIKEMHDEYLQALKVVKMDCIYIVELCHKVVDAILQIFELSFFAKNLQQVEAA